MPPITEPRPIVFPSIPTAEGDLLGRPGLAFRGGSLPATDLFGPWALRGELVRAYPELEEVCTAIGFGHGLPLGEWCREPHWALLTLARAARPPAIPPSRNWSLAPISHLVRHIINDHHRVMRNELSRLSVVIEHVALAHPTDLIATARELFADYREVMLRRFDQEESRLFPFCVRISDQALERTGRADHPQVARIPFTDLGHGENSQSLRGLIAVTMEIAAPAFDPDIEIFRNGVVALALDLAEHLAKEQRLLISGVLFAEWQVRTRRGPRQMEAAQAVAAAPMMWSGA